MHVICPGVKKSDWNSDLRGLNFNRKIRIYRQFTVELPKIYKKMSKTYPKNVSITFFKGLLYFSLATLILK